MSMLCDFTTLGGGWTLVAIQFEGDPISWAEGRKSNYDATLSSAKSFALTGSEIPSHTLTAFGRAQNASGTITTAMIDSIPFTYTTGNIANAQGLAVSYTSNSTPSRSYWVHRHSGNYYNNHDPNSAGGYNSAIWNNTLTFNLNDANINSATWAFSPNHVTDSYRGYAYGGAYLYGASELYGYAVWVK